MIKDRKKTNNSEKNPEDKKLLEKIVCKNTKKELSNTIEHLKNADNILKQYNVLLTTEKGYMTESLTQDQIVASLDVSSKTKRMDIKLNYGPYYTDFSRNGRYLLVGGERGQLSMMDWKTKDLKYDINVKEKIRAVKYLHKDTMMAVAQKSYTFIYDNKGREMHCIREIFEPSHFEYLRYHFLLVAATTKGFINYLDTSIGKIVSTIPTYRGEVNMMCQNRSNAIISTGHSTGAVCMWSPNEKEPVMKMLCHDGTLRNITIDNSGNYLVTSGQDRKLKVWDLRYTGSCLVDLRPRYSVSHLQFSDTGLLAAASGRDIHVLKDVHLGCQTSNESSVAQLLANSAKNTTGPIKDVKPYLTHSFLSEVQSIAFCPYEDILAVGQAKGFSTIFVPGSGEPNFDAFEANPYADKRFQNEQEVKQLLEKIPYEMITQESMLGAVHLPSVEEQFESDKKALFGERPVLAVKKKRSNKTKPKPATQAKICTKDNLNYERKRMQAALREPDHSDYKRKRPLERPSTGSALDNLIYKK